MCYLSPAVVTVIFTRQQPVADFITFRVRRSRLEMHIVHGRLSACVSACPSPHFLTTARTHM